MAARTNDPCSCRRGRLEIASSQRHGDYQVRYLRCRACGCTDKHVLHAVEVRRLKGG